MSSVEEPARTQALQTAPNLGSLTEDELTWGSLCHFAGVIGWVGPLICWLMKKDTSKWVDEQGKAALNFHITNTILIILLFITIVGGPAVAVYSLIMSILAGLKTKQGVPYKYPFSFNFIK
jgi:uncharacterized Tic20 family protein